MQKIAIIQISDAGSEIASQLQCELGAELIQRTDVGNQWAAYDAFVFIGAMGICVRTIAPYIEDKHTDPAVVCIDSFGLNVISVLSGHIGGANDLTRHIAAHLGAHEVITTQSDNAGLWPLDTLDKQFNWNMAGLDDINACISAFVNREPTALLMDIRDAGTDFLERTLPDHVTIVNSIDEVTPKRFRLLIQVTPYIIDTPPGVLEVCYVPKVGVLGFGLASHPANYEHILEEIDEAIT